MGWLYSLRWSCQASYNPARGWIASLKPKPIPAEYAYRVNGELGPPYGALEIRNRIITHRMETD